MRWILIPWFFVFAFVDLSAQEHTINGYVKDKANGEVLIGANVYNYTSNYGTSTNSNGYYNVTFKKDSIKLIFSHVGYETCKLELLLYRDTVIDVELIGSTLLQELVVSAEPRNETAMISAVSIRADQVSDFPTLLGETDLLKILQLIPGVQSGNEGSSGIYVRGGGPDQNLILLDGVPVYNASHLFGFFSVFNSDAIKDIHLIKGGFPARYGGRLSSVVDINMREGNYKEIKGQGSMGLISSKMTLEGPLLKDKTSFLLSARRTYIDALMYPFLKALESEDIIPRYYFYDLNLKINHKISPRDNVSLSTYFGKDKAFSNHHQKIADSEDQTYREQYGISWGNAIAVLKWNREISKNMFVSSKINYSNYKLDLYEEYEETPKGVNTGYYRGKYISGIEDLGIKIDLEYMPSLDHHLHLGSNFVDHTFKPGAIHFRSMWETDTIWGSQNSYARELTTYVEDDFKVNNWLKINYGIHYSIFFVEDKKYQSLQPRISSRIKLGKDLFFESSYADMAQYIHLLTNNGVGLPTDLWVPSTSRIKPQQSKQVTVGLSKHNSSFEITLEGYYKKMENLIEYKEGATFLSIDQDWQDKVEYGKGDSYGSEFFVQKTSGIFTGWLGYTLSWSNREFLKTTYGIERIVKFPYRYDRRHDMSITLNTKLSKNTMFSCSWVFGSGTAVTLPVSSYMSMYPDYSSVKNGYFVETEIYVKRNGYRMRDYHRLDLGFTFTKETKWGERSWHIGTFNTYNRNNPYYIDRGHDWNKNRKFIQHSLFPIMPSVSYSFKF